MTAHAATLIKQAQRIPNIFFICVEFSKLRGKGTKKIPHTQMYAGFF
jgi:hypothetical protein